jgi:TolB-like protein/Tfp pilus assembly protein PilF
LGFSVTQATHGVPCGIPQGPPIKPGPVRVLESWKEIANYLRRTPRTLRRWEKQEGLPVHRHLHEKQATVYAFAHDIDAWLRARRAPERPQQLHVAHLPQSPQLSPSESDRKGQPTRTMMIAVLPLRSLSGDPEQERFADGLTEEIILHIGQFCPNRLRVTALTSVMQHKQPSKNVGEIGRELGVDYILEGGIRRYGRRIRLTARLIAARDQTSIWADSYEIQLSPIFSLQQDLASQLADSLTAELHLTSGKRPYRATAPGGAAHNACIEGKSHFPPTDGDIKKSIERLNLAIERDPKYAPGYAELALVYFRSGLLGDYPPISTFRRIKELALKALRLNPRLALAHAMMAAFQLFGAWNWVRAEASSRRAIKLNPSDRWARIIRAAYRLVVGEPQGAIEELAEARRFNPHYPEGGRTFAILAYSARRYDMAIKCCQEMLQLDPSFAFARLILGSCHAQTGDYALALHHCEKAAELGKNLISHIAAACSIYALAGERGSAERFLEELVSVKEEQYIRYIFLAYASASLGNNERTLEWLEKAYEQRDPLLVFLKAEPRFDPLSRLPRFRDLLSRIGLPS